MKKSWTPKEPVEIPEALVKAEEAATRAYLDSVMMRRLPRARRKVYKAMREAMDAAEAARVAARAAA